jgi:hypothetical protein
MVKVLETKGFFLTWMALPCQGKAARGFVGAEKVMGKSLKKMGSGFNFKLV